MGEHITGAEITKAAHNLERLAQFVGVRRRWSLEEAGRLPAKSARKSSQAIAELVCKITGGGIATPIGVEQPSELEPADEVSAARLTKFAGYLEQLLRWFKDHSEARLPSGMDDQARSIQRSLAATDEALRLLLESQAPVREPAPPEQTPAEPPSLTRSDLGPVAVVDPDARLVLDHTWQKSLLQKRGHLMELTPETVKKLDTFFESQGFELNSHERRRLYEKVQRWIESTPNKRVLVLRVSGLSGKPDVLSSFQPAEGEDDAPVAPHSIFGTKVAGDSEEKPSPQETPATQSAQRAPQEPRAAPQSQADEPEDEFDLPDPIETRKKRSPLEEYMANPPSGVMPRTFAPPIVDNSSDKDAKDDD